MTDNMMIKQCAANVRDTCYLIMRIIGKEAKQRTMIPLSIREIIALAAIRDNPRMSLSLLSEYMGGTISGMSRMVDGLVKLGYVTRVTDKYDRRKLVISLTSRGWNVLESIDSEETSYFSEMLASLKSAECAMVNLAMILLHDVFAPDQALQTKKATHNRG